MEIRVRCSEAAGANREGESKGSGQSGHRTCLTGFRVEILVYKEGGVYNPIPAIVNEDALTVSPQNTGF